MALFNSFLFRCTIRYPSKFALAKPFGTSVNASNQSSFHRNYGTVVSSSMEYIPENDDYTDVTKEKLSKAAKSYLERAQKYDEMMTEAKAEYRVGMRHLANMMGENADTFTQADANQAVEYLFPSGLYDKKARPYLKPPEEIFPPRKAPQFDKTGRPLLSLFYTVSPHFYQLCHEAVGHMKELDKFEDSQIREQKQPDAEAKLELTGSAWLTKEQLQDFIVEDVTERNYFEYVKMMDRLAAHPYSYLAKEFLMQNRRILALQREKLKVAVPKLGEDGRYYVTIYECLRKTARADVTVISPGTGEITINGQDISYFRDNQSRQQLLFPLHFADLIGKVDIVANVQGGGHSGQSGAIRWGIAMGLRSFLDEDTVERMRLAGLLQRDYRTPERKKFGQEGARRKYTWKKR